MTGLNPEAPLSSLPTELKVRTFEFTSDGALYNLAQTDRAMADSVNTELARRIANRLQAAHPKASSWIDHFNQIALGLPKNGMHSKSIQDFTEYFSRPLSQATYLVTEQGEIVANEDPCLNTKEALLIFLNGLPLTPLSNIEKIKRRATLFHWMACTSPVRKKFNTVYNQLNYLNGVDSTSLMLLQRAFEDELHRDQLTPSLNNIFRLLFPNAEIQKVTTDILTADDSIQLPFFLLFIDRRHTDVATWISDEIADKIVEKADPIEVIQSLIAGGTEAELMAFLNAAFAACEDKTSKYVTKINLLKALNERDGFNQTYFVSLLQKNWSLALALVRMLIQEDYKSSNLVQEENHTQEIDAQDYIIPAIVYGSTAEVEKWLDASYYYIETEQTGRQIAAEISKQEIDDIENTLDITALILANGTTETCESLFSPMMSSGTDDEKLRTCLRLNTCLFYSETVKDAIKKYQFFLDALRLTPGNNITQFEQLFKMAYIALNVEAMQFVLAYSQEHHASLGAFGPWIATDFFNSVNTEELVLSISQERVIAFFEYMWTQHQLLNLTEHNQAVQVRLYKAACYLYRFDIADQLLQLINQHDLSGTLSRNLVIQNAPFLTRLFEHFALSNQAHIPRTSPSLKFIDRLFSILTFADLSIMFPHIVKGIGYTRSRNYKNLIGVELKRLFDYIKTKPRGAELIQIFLESDDLFEILEDIYKYAEHGAIATILDAYAKSCGTITRIKYLISLHLHSIATYEKAASILVQNLNDGQLSLSALLTARDEQKKLVFLPKLLIRNSARFENLDGNISFIDKMVEAHPKLDWDVFFQEFAKEIQDADVFCQLFSNMGNKLSILFRRLLENIAARPFDPKLISAILRTQNITHQFVPFVWATVNSTTHEDLKLILKLATELQQRAIAAKELTQLDNDAPEEIENTLPDNTNIVFEMISSSPFTNVNFGVVRSNRMAKDFKSLRLIYEALIVYSNHETVLEFLQYCSLSPYKSSEKSYYVFAATYSRDIEFAETILRFVAEMNAHETFVALLGVTEYEQSRDPYCAFSTLCESGSPEFIFWIIDKVVEIQQDESTRTELLKRAFTSACNSENTTLMDALIKFASQYRTLKTFKEMLFDTVEQDAAQATEEESESTTSTFYSEIFIDAIRMGRFGIVKALIEVCATLDDGGECLRLLLLGNNAYDHTPFAIAINNDEIMTKMLIEAATSASLSKEMITGNYIWLAGICGRRVSDPRLIQTVHMFLALIEEMFGRDEVFNALTAPNADGPYAVIRETFISCNLKLNQYLVKRLRQFPNANAILIDALKMSCAFENDENMIVSHHTLVKAWDDWNDSETTQYLLALAAELDETIDDPAQKILPGFIESAENVLKTELSRGIINGMLLAEKLSPNSDPNYVKRKILAAARNTNENQNSLFAEKCVYSSHIKMIFDVIKMAHSLEMLAEFINFPGHISGLKRLFSTLEKSNAIFAEIQVLADEDYFKETLLILYGSVAEERPNWANKVLNNEIPKQLPKPKQAEVLDAFPSLVFYAGSDLFSETHANTPDAVVVVDQNRMTMVI